MKNDLIAAAPAFESRELSRYLLLEKYAATGETTIVDIQQRVARALARDDEQYARFLTGLQSGFIPGGRINRLPARTEKAP